MLRLLALGLLSACERPPMQSAQQGYRGTGMQDVQNPRTGCCAEGRAAGGARAAAAGKQRRPEGQGRLSERQGARRPLRGRVHAPHAGHHGLGRARAGLHLLPRCQPGRRFALHQGGGAAHDRDEPAPQRRLGQARRQHRRHLLHLSSWPAGAGQRHLRTDAGEEQPHRHGPGRRRGAEQGRAVDCADVAALRPVHALPLGCRDDPRAAHAGAAERRAPHVDQAGRVHLQPDEPHQQIARRQLHLLPQHAVVPHLERQARHRLARHPHGA